MSIALYLNVVSAPGAFSVVVVVCVSCTRSEIGSAVIALEITFKIKVVLACCILIQTDISIFKP